MFKIDKGIVVEVNNNRASAESLTTKNEVTRPMQIVDSIKSVEVGQKVIYVVFEDYSGVVLGTVGD